MSRELLFSNEIPILLSLLGTDTLGLGLYNKPWKPSHIDIYSDGNMVVRKINTTISSTPVKVLDVSIVSISSIALNNEVIESSNPMIKKEIGFHVKCRKVHGIETYFRCILSEEYVVPFLAALQTLDPSQNLSLQKILSASNTSSKKGTAVRSPYPIVSDKPGGNKLYVSTQSVMRRAVTHAMDSYVLQSSYDRIKSRRGAFTWLPVFFSNDLIHGSWWFAIGSLIFMVAAAVTLVNSFDEIIGDDDSFLSRYHYRATWALSIISGVFFTLGSLAFIRAFHDEPPMKPLFKWYHVQNDELLASWLFLWGSVPAIPFCLIYLAEENDNQLFFGGLIVAGFLVLGSYLFVLASYPSDRDRKQYFYPISKYLCCCCCGEKGRRKYFINDWLAGTWIIYYGTLVATIISFAFFISGIVRNRDLPMFINGTTLVENVCFLIGSAYFVAGSFPDEVLNTDDDDEGSGKHDEDYMLMEHSIRESNSSSGL